MLYVLGKSTVCRKPAARQTRKLTLELLGYLRNNSDSLPNYGRRYRASRSISSAFVESAVNQLIDKRMSKSQQMRWIRAARTFCCRCGCASSMVTCAMISPAGIPPSLPMTPRCHSSRDPSKSNALLPRHTRRLAQQPATRPGSASMTAGKSAFGLPLAPSSNGSTQLFQHGFRFAAADGSETEPDVFQHLCEHNAGGRRHLDARVCVNPVGGPSIAVHPPSTDSELPVT